MKRISLAFLIILYITIALSSQQQEEQQINRETGISNSQIADCFEKTMRSNCNLSYFKCLKDEKCEKWQEQIFTNCYIMDSIIWYDPKCMQEQFEQVKKKNQAFKQNLAILEELLHCLNKYCYLLDDQLVSKKEFYTKLKQSMGENEDEKLKSLILYIQNMEETQEAFRKKPKSDEFSKKFSCLYQILQEAKLKEIIEQCQSQAQCLKELEIIKECLHYQEECEVDNFYQRFQSQESRFIYEQVREFCPSIFGGKNFYQERFQKLIQEAKDVQDGERLKAMEAELVEMEQKMQREHSEKREASEKERERILGKRREEL